MIKTRTTFGIGMPMIATLYLKGPRQRMQHGPDISGNRQSFGLISITQCDQRVVYHINPSTKTYNVFHEQPLESPSRRVYPLRTIPGQTSSGAEVLVTIDSVDTGERKEVGSYQARHVKTTITVEPGKDAETHPSRADIDGWYIDLAGLNCHEEELEPLLPPAMMIRPGSFRDHRTIKHLGTAPHGYTVEETARIKENGNTVINKTELVAVSEDQIDSAFFELPEGYTERQPGMAGRVLLRPDQDILRPTP